MWPSRSPDLTHGERFDIVDRNPEEAAQRGKWGDVEFLERVAEDVNPGLEHTQFADYHGHGWIFRAVLKTDRKGNLGELEDLYRVVSLVGLAVSLLLVSLLYQRFVFRRASSEGS